MIKLNIISENIFGLKYHNINIDDKIIKTYDVPDDYLLSPFIEANTINNIIYLENSEYYPIEGIIIGQNIDLQDALYFADFYQMYDVSSYIKFISTLNSESYPIIIPDLLLEKINKPYNLSIQKLFDENLIDNLIIHILKVENYQFWKRQSFTRDEKVSISYKNLENKYIEKVPTNINCFILNPLLCWKNIKTKADIRRLLYLLLKINTSEIQKEIKNEKEKYEPTILNKKPIEKSKLLFITPFNLSENKVLNYDENNINMNIIEIATKYSSLECYPYREYINKYNKVEICKITRENIYNSLNIFEEMIIDNGGVLYYSNLIKNKFINDETPYYAEYEEENKYGMDILVIYADEFDNFIYKISKITPVEKLSKDEYKIYYSYIKSKRNIYTFCIIKRINEPDKLFKLKIFLDKHNYNLEISSSHEFLIYLCTGIMTINSSNINTDNKLIKISSKFNQKINMFDELLIENNGKDFNKELIYFYDLEFKYEPKLKIKLARKNENNKQTIREQILNSDILSDVEKSNFYYNKLYHFKDKLKYRYINFKINYDGIIRINLSRLI